MELPPQITSLSTKFMHERGGVPQLDKYLGLLVVGVGCNLGYCMVGVTRAAISVTG